MVARKKGGSVLRGKPKEVSHEESCFGAGEEVARVEQGAARVGRRVDGGIGRFACGELADEDERT
jgi:hypothetical protein